MKSQSRTRLTPFFWDKWMPKTLNSSRLVSVRRSFSTESLSPSGLWSRYLYLLDRHPLSTKSVTTAVLCLSGDAISQWAVNKNEGGNTSLNVARMLKFGLIGLIWIGPVLHVWYGAIMRYFPGTGAKVGVYSLDSTWRRA